MSASDRLPPKGPSPTWLVPTIGGLIGSLVVSQWVDFQNPLLQGKLAVFDVLVHGGFALAVAMLLRGLAGAPRWLRLHGIARQYPFEPWRWEFSRGAELVDEQAAQVSEAIIGIFVFTPLLLIFTALMLWLILGGEAPIPVVIFMTGLLGVMGWAILRKGLIPAITRVLAFLRYGQTRLLLQQFPLVPGSKTQVKLTMPRGLADLGHVRGVVRRVRERTVVSGPRNNRNSHTFQDVEVRQPQFINAQEGQNGNTLSFVLTVPPAGPEDSTGISGASKCFWELQLTSDVPGLDLDIIFKLPVYWVEEGHSSAA